MQKKSKNYWNKDVEQAVVEFIEQPEKRVIIWEDKLHAPLVTMVESIMYRYGLWKNQDYTPEELRVYGLAHAYHVLPKFNPTKGTKAYSYLGTCIKRKFQQMSMEDVRKHKGKVSLDGMEEHIRDMVISDHFHDDGSEQTWRELFDVVMQWWTPENIERYFNKNQHRMIYAVLDLLQNYSNASLIFEGKKKLVHVIADHFRCAQNTVRYVLTTFRIINVVLRKHLMEYGCVAEENGLRADIIMALRRKPPRPNITGKKNKRREPKEPISEPISKIIGAPEVDSEAPVPT